MSRPTTFPHFPRKIVVAGIDTDAGKTLVSALFCLGLPADYWKPVQAGTTSPTDTEWVRSVSGLTHSHCWPEAYRLARPASPHLAAAAENVRIEEDRIVVPDTPGRLVIEGAGGLMVPLRDDLLYIDLLASWRLPVVLVVRTYLGCINHSLLSLEALERRGIPLAGLVFNAGRVPDPSANGSEEIIARRAGAPVLGRIPAMDRVDGEVLPDLWEAEFAERVAGMV